METKQNIEIQPAQIKLTPSERMAKAREVRKLKVEEKKKLPPDIQKFIVGQSAKLKATFREQFKEKFEKIFGNLTNIMLKVAEGYQVVVAREWEYNEKTKERHRTGKWKRVTDTDELVNLMNGLDEGDDDSYHMIVMKDPSVDMLKYISDQLMGKANQNVSLKHDIGLGDILAEIRSRNKGVIAERGTNKDIKQIMPITSIRVTKPEYEEYIPNDGKNLQI